MKHYNIKQLAFYPLRKGMMPAIQVARMHYLEHTDLNFEADLQDYLANGFVCSRPSVFGMVKLVAWKGEPAWFVRMAVGNVLELRQILPWPLETLLFCRNNQKDVVREYSLSRIDRMLVKMMEKQNVSKAVQPT
jgi:hypothetical protein